MQAKIRCNNNLIGSGKGVSLPLARVFCLPERVGRSEVPGKSRDPERVQVHDYMKQIILASTSPRRAELLRQLGLEFKVVASDVPEIHQEQLTGRELAQINAYRKARGVAKKNPDALVVGADTLVCLNEVVFGKPATLEAAYEMLEELQGRTHQVVSAICLLHLRSHRQKVFADLTAVTFRPLDAVKIRRYLTKVNPLDKAGGYAIQEEGDLIIEKISGSRTNVVGLPLERLKQELDGWAGITVPWQAPLEVVAGHQKLHRHEPRPFRG